MNQKKIKGWLAACFLPVLFTGCASVGGWLDYSAKAPPLPVVRPSVALGSPWQDKIAASANAELTPVTSGKLLYAASGRQVYRLDATTGRMLGSSDTGRRLTGGVGAAEGLVAVGGADGMVLVYNEALRPVWSHDLHSEIVGAPSISQGHVIVRTLDGRIVALDAANGQPQWTFQRPLPSLVVRSHAGVVAIGGAVFAGLPAGHLVALGANDGALGWDSMVSYPRGVTDIERVNDIVSLPIVIGQGVCAVTFQGRVGCYDGQTGNLIWSKDLSSATGLATDGHNLFASDARGRVYAFDLPTGAQFWTQDKLAGRRLTAPQIVGRHILLGDQQGYVHVLSADDGELQGRLATDGSAILSQPQSDGQGVVVQTRNGHLQMITVR